MTITNEQSEELDIAKMVAPEDLQRGDYVAILDVIVEHPSHRWWCSERLDPYEVVRLALRNRRPGKPLKIKEICLPFVLVRRPDRKHQTIDVRACRLVRLTRKFAKAVLKTTKAQQPPPDPTATAQPKTT